MGPVSRSSVSNNSGQRAAPCIRGGVAFAFTAISIGAFGDPVEGAARVAMGTVVEEAKSLESVVLDRFVLFGADDLEVYERMLAGSSRAG